MEVNFAFRQHYLMKLKTCHTRILTAVFFTLLLPAGAMAQDDRFSFEENSSKEVVKQDPDVPSGSEIPESKLNKGVLSAPAQEAPAVTREAEPKPKTAVKSLEKSLKEEEKIQKKEEEDPLSFNFLYYIIEKFKFSDIVE
jgi:hypothetical protein